MEEQTVQAPKDQMGGYPMVHMGMQMDLELRLTVEGLVLQKGLMCFQSAEERTVHADKFNIPAMCTITV